MLQGSPLSVFSDRLLSTKAGGSASCSEVSTPLAGAGPPLDFPTGFVGGSGSDINSTCPSVTSECISAPQNGASAVKKAKISIQTSSAAVGGCAASAADVKKVVPTTGDILALAIEIKRDHPGCGVKKVLLQMVLKNPDWAITEHRVNKLLHENGLANVKAPSSATAKTDNDHQSQGQQPRQVDAAVADIHFDILSLPQSHAASAQHEESPSYSSSNSSGSPRQLADIIDLDQLFKPVSGQHTSSTAHASRNEAVAALGSSESIDLEKTFVAAAVPANLHDEH
jgi:hypothetical protein